MPTKTVAQQVPVTTTSSVDTLTNQRGPWMDNGILAVKSRMQSFVSGLKQRGVQVAGKPRGGGVGGLHADGDVHERACGSGEARGPARREHGERVLERRRERAGQLTIRTQKDATEKYGRCLATLIAGDVNLNEAMIAAGHAVLLGVNKDVISMEDNLRLRYNKPNLINPAFIAK